MVDGDYLAWADLTARSIAHANMPRCTGGTGHGPGGDGPRWHTDKCDALAADILMALRSAPHRLNGASAQAEHGPTKETPEVPK